MLSSEFGDGEWPPAGKIGNRAGDRDRLAARRRVTFVSIELAEERRHLRLGESQSMVHISRLEDLRRLEGIGGVRLDQILRQRVTVDRAQSLEHTSGRFSGTSPVDPLDDVLDIARGDLPDRVSAQRREDMVLK